jgi:hypothetical protein
MKRKRIRVDFIEHPSGSGYVVAVNGRRVGDRFAHSSEVTAFAKALGAVPQYAGTDDSQEGPTPSGSGSSGGQPED